MTAKILNLDMAPSSAPTLRAAHERGVRIMHNPHRRPRFPTQSWATRPRRENGWLGWFQSPSADSSQNRNDTVLKLALNNSGRGRLEIMKWTTWFAIARWNPCAVRLRCIIRSRAGKCSLKRRGGTTKRWKRSPRALLNVTVRRRRPPRPRMKADCWRVEAVRSLSPMDGKRNPAFARELSWSTEGDDHEAHTHHICSRPDSLRHLRLRTKRNAERPRLRDRRSRGKFRYTRQFADHRQFDAAEPKRKRHVVSGRK